jgi:hypothetical protein
MSQPTKPNFFQLVRYCLGRRLPDSMLDWVRDDLTGPGATRRVMLRVLVPAVLVLTPFWFFPIDWVTRASMTVPILIPFIYFSHALNKIWRRHMLQVHGLDPHLIEKLQRQKDAHIHDAYIEKYGPRSGPPSSRAV